MASAREQGAERPKAGLHTMKDFTPASAGFQQPKANDQSNRLGNSVPDRVAPIPSDAPVSMLAVVANKSAVSERNKAPIRQGFGCCSESWTAKPTAHRAHGPSCAFEVASWRNRNLRSEQSSSATTTLYVITRCRIASTSSRSTTLNCSAAMQKQRPIFSGAPSSLPMIPSKSLLFSLWHR